MTPSTAGPEALLALDDADAPMFTVGQVAQILGVQPAFVRRLDTQRIVSPQRSAGGQRRYSRQEIAQVQLVWAMQGEGMTLPGIRRILALEAEVAGLQARVLELQQALDGR